MALLGGQVGVATEVEVCLEAELGQGALQALDANAEAACLAVYVWALEAEDYKNGLARIEYHQPPSARSAIA